LTWLTLSAGDGCPSHAHTSSFAAKSIEAGERADIGFLKHVLGVGVVPQDAASNAVEPPVMLLDEQPDGLAVLLPCSVDELTLVRSLLKATGLWRFDPLAPSCLRCRNSP
jgi:hypothetical protein